MYKYIYYKRVQKTAKSGDSAVCVFGRFALLQKDSLLPEQPVFCLE